MAAASWNWKPPGPWKRNPKQDKRRGEYENISSPSSKGRKLLRMGYVLALLLAGVALMLAHHFFYAFLNEKSVDPTISGPPSVLKDQSNVNFIGTTIAHGVRIVLSLAVGVTMVQLFWNALRFQAITLERIDALVKCGKSPFNFSAPRAASASFPVLGTSLTASAMALVVILTPGSLTVATDFQQTRSCEVFTVPPILDSTCTSSGITLNAISLNVLASNTYIPPLLLDRDAACGGGASTCAYDVSFHGPAFDCTDTTNQTDFSPFLHPAQLPSDAPSESAVWNASFVDGNFTLEVLTHDIARDVVRATRCTTYNATYDARVISLDSSTGENDGSNSTTVQVQVQNVSLHSTLESLDEMPFISTYAISALQKLKNLIFAGPAGFVAGAVDDSPIQTSQLFGTTPNGTFTFNDDIMHFLTSYMQNISISLLSGNAYYCFSNDTATNLESLSTTCDVTLSVYLYDSTRLLATYGVALGVAGLVAMVGCWFVWRDGKEETLLFSQLMQISLNKEMLRASGHLHAKMSLCLEQRVDDLKIGKLVPASEEDGSDEVFFTSSSDSEKDTQQLREFAPTSTLWNRSWKYLDTVQGKSALLIVLAIICMVLHHAYYHYVARKVPSSQLRLSDSQWLVDQTIVSDVGIALAYLAQTLLGVTIAMSLTQRFWRILRSRARTISEIDALMSVQNSPFSTSTFRALRASPSVAFLAFLAASLTVISIFAPGSISVSSNHEESRGCTIPTPRNLSAMSISNDLDSLFIVSQMAILASLASGTYLPPINPCDLGDSAGCSYKLSFVGPGFDCQDVSASSNETAFITSFDSVGKAINLFDAPLLPQDETLTMNVSAQTWDARSSTYTATNWLGVLRSYSVVVSHTNASSSIEVIETHIDSVVHANISQLTTFPETYLRGILIALGDIAIRVLDTPNQGQISSNSEAFVMGNLFTVQLDGHITWNSNMPLALETFAQNAALSVLSGQIFAFSADDPSLLQNSSTTCTYSFPAYEYAPYQLFLTYGITIFITLLCAIFGSYAIKQNSVEESMDFSRILRAGLNEDMFNARRDLNRKTEIKADGSKEGSLIPLLFKSSDEINMHTLGRTVASVESSSSVKLV